MPRDTLLLVGRDDGRARSVFETHADRLRQRGVADAIRTLTYEHEPRRELRERLQAVDGERVVAVPTCLAHDRTTTRDLPAALADVPGEVDYCEPVGRAPELTRAITARAGEVAGDGDDTALVLVGFGASGTPHQRQVVASHAERLRARDRYAEVESCFLLQNPTVECVRYNVSAPSAVAVPLFLAPCEATEREIPAKLELDRGGVAYADPLGTHGAVTDAIAATVQRERALDAPVPRSFEDALTASNQALATDGDGTPR